MLSLLGSRKLKLRHTDLPPNRVCFSFNWFLVPFFPCCFRCDTVLPVQGGVYRRLSATTVSQGERASDALSMFAEATVLPYVKDLVRGNLCAFIAGSLDEIDQVEVAVMSVLQFLPGMTVAVAADNAAFDAYDRCETKTTIVLMRALFLFRYPFLKL